MKSLSFGVLFSVVCSAALLGASAWAQQPAKPPKQTMQAKELLAKCVEASRNARSVNYSAEVTTQGAGAPSYSGTVGAQKTEAGPWAILVLGNIAPQGGESRRVQVAFDGVTGRSISDTDQTVTETNATSDDDVRLFFMSQEAGPTVAWEILFPDSLANSAKNASLEIVGRGSAGGVDCKILEVGSTVAGTASPEITRYFIPAGDHLPRKIERVTGQPGATTTQTLVLKDLKAGEKLAPSQFVLAIPDGYTVKAANKKPPKPKTQRPQSNPSQSRREGIAIGTQAPDWKLKNSDGAERSLADYKGKVIVMDFWGTWCPPCRMAMPAIQKVHEKFQGKPVAVLGMNFEQRAQADPAGFMKQNGYTYELLLNAETMLEKYQVRAFPTLIIVGMDGKVTYVDTGYKPELEAELTQAIEDALVQ